VRDYSQHPVAGVTDLALSDRSVPDARAGPGPAVHKVRAAPYMRPLALPLRPPALNPWSTARVPLEYP
jgi:hypothetical protein